MALQVSQEQWYRPPVALVAVLLGLLLEDPSETLALGGRETRLPARLRTIQKVGRISPLPVARPPLVEALPTHTEGAGDLGGVRAFIPEQQGAHA
jgi:hypothetical protein